MSLVSDLTSGSLSKLNETLRLSYVFPTARSIPHFFAEVGSLTSKRIRRDWVLRYHLSIFMPMSNPYFNFNNNNAVPNDNFIMESATHP
jgi:hypothetical protein